MFSNFEDIKGISLEKEAILVGTRTVIWREEYTGERYNCVQDFCKIFVSQEAGAWCRSLIKTDHAFQESNVISGRYPTMLKDQVAISHYIN